MAKGGSRPNAGRKPGQKNKATLEFEAKAAELVGEVEAAGLSPLEVMLLNMRYLQEEAEKGVAVEENGKIHSPLSLRMLASDVASKAAPFLHPKLSAVELDANVTHKTLAQELADLNAQSDTAGD